MGGTWESLSFYGKSMRFDALGREATRLCESEPNAGTSDVAMLAKRRKCSFCKMSHCVKNTEDMDALRLF
eukprot:2072793-Amphidinium_carterae.4